jgi:hypothetical protein
VSGLCLLLAAVFAWCALAPGNVQVEVRPAVPVVQPAAGR